MPNGSKVRVVAGHYYVGEVVTVVSPYRGPFGPSVVVRRANGDEVAMRIAHLAVM